MEVKFSTCLTSVLILPEPYIIAPPLFTIMHWSTQSRASLSPAARASAVGPEAAANMKQASLVIFAPLKFLRIIGFAFFFVSNGCARAYSRVRGLRALIGVEVGAPLWNMSRASATVQPGERFVYSRSSGCGVRRSVRHCSAAHFRGDARGMQCEI